MEELRTRIMCTIGPASASPMVLARMMRAGMDVARLNFSHGTHKEHAALFRAAHTAARKAGKTVAIVQDIQGQKIRVGELPAKGILLREGQTVTLTTSPIAYSTKVQKIPLTYHGLHKDIAKDHRILLDDGAIALSVLRVRDRDIYCSVDVGGTLLSHKGVNVPDTRVASSALTAKDKEDIAFGVALGVDWVCVSFVSEAKDIRDARTLVQSHARTHRIRPPRIMAKVERRLALDHLDMILDASDGIMLGRGDLGIEIDAGEVPMVQKDVAERCRAAGKPCVIATHMLESMKNLPRATRAEISDVANAVFEHVDAVMLSAESAVGKYPDIAVQTMAGAILRAEASRYDNVRVDTLPTEHIGEALAQTLALLAEGKGIAAILVPAHLDCAKDLARYRPAVHLGYLVPDAQAARQVMLYWGATPIIADDNPATLVLRAPAIAKATWKIPKKSRIAVLHSLGKGGVQVSFVEV